jgi:hypothetical protein
VKITITNGEVGYRVVLRGGTDDEFRRALDLFKKFIARESRHYDRENRCWVIDFDEEAALNEWSYRVERLGARVVKVKQPVEQNTERMVN